MRKFFKIVGVLALTAICGAEANAKQTLEEATDSIKSILIKARGGNAEAQNEVGGWYYRGRHVKQNYEEALQWWAKAAKQGNTLAIGNMGLCYQTGHGIEPDSLKASKLYLRSIKDGNKALFKQNVEQAEKGSIFSNMLVAECYKDGIGVQKDPAAAIPFLTNAAKKNCTTAQRDLGLMLLNNKKANEAAPWFKKASENGDNAGTFYYGKMLLEGLGIMQDKKEGANYLLKAAENGFPQAMFYVANCYMDGNGLTKNAEQAIKWLRLGAGKGSHNAQWQLAQCYREGIGTTVNYEQALYWYAEASLQGHKRAFKNLITDSIPDSPFVAYLKGIKAYRQKDFAAALNQFKTVEKAKVADGKIMTGVIYANPKYEKYNLKKGVKLLTEAAKDNAQAMYLLAGLYEAGKGVDKDMAKAVEYMTASAEQGFGSAESALGDMYFEGRGVEQNYAEAVKWYTKAYDQGQLSENSAKRLAGCYEDGKGGLTPDKEKAEAILKSQHDSPIPELLKMI